MLKFKTANFATVALLLTILTGCVSATRIAQAADTVKLAENGKALATIEISPQASVETRSVAQEMANYLERITGAPFEIAQAPGPGARIVLGRNSEFPNLNMGARLRGNGQEAFLMHTTGDRVLLLGVTDRAASHATYTFLEKLGVRWFFPTDEWEIVPTQSTLTINVDEVQSPDMTHHRDIWYGSMHGGFTANHLRIDWMRRNRMKTDGPRTSHSWIGLDPKKDFAENPEWFAQVKGERRNSKPNYGHPEVVKKAVEASLRAAEGGATTITVSAPDGLGFCECDQCLQVAGVARDTLYVHNSAIFGKRPDGTDVCVTSETIFRMANTVAEAVSKQYPNVLIGVLGYSGYAHPPSFDLHPNIYVSVTSMYRRTPLSYDDQIRAYGQRSRQIGVYEYYHIAVFYGWHPSRGAKMSDLQERMKFYHANRVLGVHAEATNNWLPAGLDFYVASKLMWDVNADVDAIYADFLDKSFGAAKAPMKSYYGRWEAKTEMNPASLGGALGDLIAAYQLADSEAAKVRIAHLYLYNRFLRLGEEYKKVENDEEKSTPAGKEYSDLFWRLQDTLLLHDLVTGSVRRPMIPAFTAQEIDSLMAQDTAWIKENRNLFLTYSRNLVPIAAAGKATPGLQAQPVSAGRFRTLQLIIPAQAGETLEIGLTPRAETSPYRITFMTADQFQTAAGNSLAEAVTSGDAADKVSFTAAKTGFYRVVVTNLDGVTSVSHPHALDGGEQALNSATMYFYVPQGTKEFTVATGAHGGPTVTVKDAAGNTVYEKEGFAITKKAGEPGSIEAVVTVPPGTDGAIWSITGPANVNSTSGIRLIGVPQYFSFSPQQLLVAQEYLK